MRLTHWLTPIETVSDMQILCNFDSHGGGSKNDKVPLVSSGHVLTLQDSRMKAAFSERFSYPVTSVVSGFFNPEDLLDPYRWTSDVSRLSGCCDVSGIDGLTNICHCGNEIGTTQADCWTWFVFKPETLNTYWKNNEKRN